MKSLLLTALSCFFIVNAFSQVNLNQGLIGYFPFNGDASDRSGFNNNPTYNNGTLAADRFGNPNQAYWFNGIDNSMTIPGAAGLNTAAAMSVALYFNPENTNLATLVGKIDYIYGNGTQFQVAINWSAYPGVLFGINNPADACSQQINVNSSYVNTGGSLPINQWYCLACTYDRGVQKIFLNGVLIQQRTTSFNALKQCSNSDIQIGTWWMNDQQRFKGRIDDVRIYNRALNQAEVTALCTTCSAPNTDFTYKQDICNPMTVQFTGLGGNLLDPHWDFGDGTPQSTLPNPVHTYANPGNYPVKFIVQNANCKDTITKSIDIKVTDANIVITNDTAICLNTSAQLRGQPALSFCWSPAASLTNANTTTPIATPQTNTTYYYTAEIPLTNLVRNGDFSNGNVDFTSQYAYTTFNGGASEYTVTATPASWNPLLGACTDHTTGNGNMLLINGATAANVKVWTQTIAVTPNTNYAFSAWLQNANVNGAGSNPPQLQFSINGYNLGNIMQGRQQMCVWDQFYSVWNSGNSTTATISIVNQNTVASGNDYALDDISFAELKIFRDSVKVNITPCTGCDKNWLQVGAQPAYVNLGDLDISGNQITVEAKINRTAPYTGILYAGDVVSKHTVSGNTNYLLRPNTAEITTTNGYYRTPDICEIELNKTYHIAMVYDGSTLKFYRDGYLMSQVAATGNLFQNNLPTLIGQYSGAGAENFVGFVNEVRIWNVARSQADIRANMNTSLPSPATQTGLQAYYVFDNAINKQGNPAWNGTVTGNATLGAANNNCVLKPDSCKKVLVQFTTPDTVCVNTPVTITNTSTNASSYYWNFCVADINTPPLATNIGNPGNLLTGPVFMDYVYDNGNYYAFVTNFTVGKLVRLDFGNSLLNTPMPVNLGNYNGLLQTSGTEGIQIVQNEGKWYALIVGGSVLSNTQPRIVKIDFGTSITNPGTATNWGNIGNFNQPVDLHVFKEGNIWYGFAVNAEDNTITRFNFTNSFNNTPTATNLGNVGGLLYPTGIYAINDNGFWRVFITNAGDNMRNGTQSSLTRLDFGSSLLNTPTGVNLGNPGGQLKHPRDFTIMKFCGEIVGFAVNGNPAANNLVRLNFGNSLTTTPTITSLGNTGSLDFPHSLSKLFRVNDDVYAFITNVANNTITRLRFAGCTNASVSSSTDENPQPITYSTPGTYNINLTIDDGLPTQSSYCKQVVVLPEPTHTPTQAINICTGDNIKIGTGVKYAKYTWNTSAATDSIIVNTAGTYWVQTDRFGCTNKDTMIVSEIAKPVVDLGVDASLCQMSNMVLDAGNAGATYLWQDGSTAETFTATAFGKYYVRVTNATGCISSDTITLSPTILTPVDFSYKQDICDPHTIAFTANGGAALNPYWSFGDGNTNTGTVTATHTYAAYSNYTVKFGYESNGCKDTITKLITVNVTWSDLIITPDTTICFNTTKQLRTQPALSFCWSPTTWLSDPNTQNPVTSATGKITYYYTAEVPGANIITNGDFSNGNVDFTSSYQYSTTGLNPAQYFVGTNPVLWHPQMAACKDHTTGTGNMLLVNGAQQLNANVWSQTITVTPNTNYAFSAWLQNISTVNPARLQFSINNIPLGNIFEANSTSCLWEQFYSSWNSGTQTTATISIVNMNQVFSGNDFALDDISFAPVYIQRDSVIISVDTPVVIARTDTTVCKDAQVQMQASGAASWAWAPAAGLSSTTISNPVATVAANTEYIVTGTTIYGCSAKDTVNVSLHPVPDILTDKEKGICPETSVQLVANNTLTNYSWTPATGLSNTAISNPVASPDVNTEYIVSGTTAEGCTVKDTINVNIYTLPVVIVDRTINICPNIPIQLGSNNALASWSWTPATGLSSTTISNPVATPDVSTEYRLTGVTTDGCTVKDTISINLYTLPTVIVDRTLNACLHSPVQLSANNTMVAWSWSPAAGLNNTTISNPVATPATSTQYILTGRSADGCTVKDTVDVNLYPVPAVVTNHDLTICPKSSVQLVANNTMTSWSWTPALYLNNPAIASPTAAPANSLTYTVQVKDQYNCNYSDTVHVQIREIRFNLQSHDQTICYGQSVALQATGGDLYSWSPAASLNNGSIANPVAKPETSTTYTVYSKENTCGFDSTMQVQVTVNPTPVVDAIKANDITCLLPTAQLHATGSAGSSYAWTPVTGLNKANLADPVSAADTTTTYFVTATNQFGCSATDTVTVFVEADGKWSFAAPNAFTPNYDGHNDCFRVITKGGAVIEEFAIFNRWGQRLFSSNNQTACWDGRFNGEKQPAGTYVYMIKVRTVCGNIKKGTGTVLLVR